jgi:plasmid stabilization system protein ParE
MALEVAWSSEAREDLNEILLFIGRDSPVHAAAVLEEIEQSVDKLSGFPRLGHCVPELHDENLREVVVYSFRVIYRVRPDCVYVLGVVHGARLLPRALQGRPLE